MRPSPSLLLVPLLLLAAPAAAQEAPTVRYLPAEAGRPFSPLVQVGNTLYLSGAIGVLPSGTLAPGGIEAETRQALENVRATLAAAGATMDDVVRCTVFLADMAEWGRMNGVYATFFPHHFPARSAVGVTGLALGARTEIECTAVIGARAAP
jgi:reactive intermediate/imine deaminase